MGPNCAWDRVGTIKASAYPVGLMQLSTLSSSSISLVQTDSITRLESGDSHPKMQCHSRWGSGLPIKLMHASLPFYGP